MVQILYFAQLRERLGMEREQLALASGVHDVRELLAYLRQRGASWVEALRDEARVRVAVETAKKLRAACLCAASGALLAMLHVGDAGAAGNAAAGEAKIRVCQACHNHDGNSPHNPMWEQLTTADFTGQSGNDSLRRNPVWPKLAGQNAVYLARQLRLFKTGARKDPLMSAMVAELTDADIEDIAAFFSSQRAQPASTMASVEVIGRGRDLYQRGNTLAGVPACMSCHGPNAHGTEEFPRLAGQHEVYLKKQLWAFKTGQRASPVMSPIASGLTDADIDAVAAYLSTRE